MNSFNDQITLMIKYQIFVNKHVSVQAQQDKH